MKDEKDSPVHKGSHMYNVQIRVRLEGSIVAALPCSLQEAGSTTQTRDH